jgi:hypothetical protein
LRPWKRPARSATRKLLLVTNQLNSAAPVLSDVTVLAEAHKTLPNHSRYKAANPAPFSGLPDTLLPWRHQEATHLHLAEIIDPTTQYIFATKFLAPGPLTWVQALTGVNNQGTSNFLLPSHPSGTKCSRRSTPPTQIVERRRLCQVGICPNILLDEIHLSVFNLLETLKHYQIHN